MSTGSDWSRTGLLALAVAALSGCSLLQPPPERAPQQVADEWPDVLAEPVTHHEWRYVDDRQTVFGKTQMLKAHEADTFSDIARSYGLGYDELKHANPEVDPWLPGADTVITLPTRFIVPEAPQEGIVLNIAAKRLYWFSRDSDEQLVLTTYPIGIGRVGWATPTGTARVIAKATDPSWYVPASVRAEHKAAGDPLPAVVPPGPDNPLGRHVLKLDMPGYLLHGTNQPYGVGMRVSHGCVRLYPEDIEVLYTGTPRGTPVTIVNQPLVAGWQAGTLWLAAYPILEDDERTVDDLVAESIEYLADRHGVFVNDSLEASLRALIERADGVAVQFTTTEWVADQALAVMNVTALPDDAPTREEVSELMEALMQESAATPEGAPL